MSDGCLFCHEAETSPSISSIVEALQKVIKSLVAKESDDKLSLQTSLQKVESLQAEVESLNTEKSKLQQECKHLYASLTTIRERSDQYKHKFLGAQDALIELHKKNRELLRLIGAKRTSGRPFPFKLSDNESRGEPIILAPDTCFNESNYDSGSETIKHEIKEEISESEMFVKPRFPVQSRPNKSTPKNIKVEKNIDMVECTIDLVDCVVDPDETCLLPGNNKDDDCDITEDDNEEFSIPASPILNSGNLKKVLNAPESPFVMLNVMKQCNGDKSPGLDLTDIGSPSLLPPCGQGKQNLFKKVENESNQMHKSKEKHSIFDDEWCSMQDSSVDFQDCAHNDSLRIHHKNTNKKVGISPIKMQSTSRLADPSTTMDALFDKTDGELFNLSKTRDMDETHFDPAEQLDNGDNNGSIVISDDERMSDNDDFVDFSISTPKPPPTKKKCFASLPDRTSTDNHDDSFDKVPKKAELGYKFQSVVRKRDERRKLDAKSCAQCEDYYSDLPPEERARTIKEICRHRHEFAPPSTPKHFWDIGIPDTQECKRRGYIVDAEDLNSQEQGKVPQRRRRKKPLQSRLVTKQ